MPFIKMPRLILAISLALLSQVSSLGVVSNMPSLIQQYDTLSPAFMHHSSLIASSLQSGIHIPTSASDIYSMYKQALSTDPLETKCATGAVLAIIGDAIAQSREPDTEYDTKRASAFILFDMSYRALQHLAFPIITDHCHGQYILGAIAASPFASLVSDQTNPAYFAAMEQSLACQLGLVPFIYYPVFYALTAFVQGLSRENAIERAKETFIPLMKRNYLFWIPVQFAVFGFIEEDLQIPLLCVSGVIWTIIMSLAVGSTKKYTQEKEFIERDMLKNMDDTALVDFSQREKNIRKSQS